MNVAHYFEMVREGTLPTDFNQWDLADKDGQTVAQVASAQAQQVG